MASRVPHRYQAHRIAADAAPSALQVLAFLAGLFGILTGLAFFLAGGPPPGPA